VTWGNQEQRAEGVHPTYGPRRVRAWRGPRRRSRREGRQPCDQYGNYTGEGMSLQDFIAGLGLGIHTPASPTIGPNGPTSSYFSPVGPGTSGGAFLGLSVSPLRPA
jgi:hypothetical protein